MIEEVHVDVLVDDLPAVEGVYPAHGLAVLITVKYDAGYTRTVLFDTGPSAKILVKNAEALGVDVRPDIVFGSLPHFHHLGALRSLPVGAGLVLPPPPLAARAEDSLRELPGVPEAYVVAGDTYWNEQGLALKTRRGWLVFLGCSVHGLRRTFGARLASLGRVWGLVGGLGTSSRDFASIGLLRYLSRRGLELVVPLHSTSMEARKVILKRFNRHDFGYEVSGCGVQFDV